MIGRLAEPCSTALLEKSTVRAQTLVTFPESGTPAVPTCGSAVSRR